MADLGGFRRGSSGMRKGFLVRNLSLHTPPSSPPGVRLGAPRRRQRPRRLALETHNSPFPTWGQIKRLAVTAQDMLTTEGKPFTPENLFLAMLALLSFQSVSEEPSLPSPSSG
ncbi:periphilin-1-like [Hylobates moloch]|uniref:periphilin-1-like n=1 Tax=Hylobates moloch TaxID=81572 RepID=UPI002674DB08|nr:periphilin-1-like [Hylobates moloch]XP_058298731.1 periphilin-1-like [Hylobates moloch]